MLNEKELKVLDLIQDDEAYENYFFKKLKNVKWFFALKQREYFKPERFANKEEKSSQLKYNILSYLEKISLQINEPGRELYAGELLEIIDNVSNYKDSSGKHIDNYNTWRYFVRILINIPNNQIHLEIIDLISIWINSKFGIIMKGEKIEVDLLLKFLPEIPTRDDIEKAERIIDLITEYEWRTETNFFGKEEEVPKTIIDLNDLTSAFLQKKIAKRIGEKCTDSVIFTMADKFKEILIRTNSPYSIEAEYNNGHYRLTVCLKKDFEFDCSIDFIEEDKPLSERLVGELTGKPSEEREKIYDFKIENCVDSKIFSTEIEKNISIANIPDEIKKEFYKKMEELYEGVFDDRSAVWHKRIACYGGDLIRDPKPFFAFVLTEIVYAKVKADHSCFDNIYQQFAGEKYQFLFYKRLLLFIINKFLKEIIGKGPAKYSSDESKDRQLNDWRQKWYSALKDNTEFKALYEKEKKISGRDIEIYHRGTAFAFRPESLISPISKDKLLEETNDDLAELARTLKTKQLEKGFLIDRLSDELIGAAKEKPWKFVNNLDPFLNTGYDFVNNVLSGILEALRLEKKEIVNKIDWDRLVAFMKSYIDRDEFWQDKLGINFSSFDANHKWVVGVIADLVEAGTKTDDLAFDKKYNEVAKKIILLILKRLEIETKDSIEDPVSYVLNSIIGKTITALINLSLRIARLENRENEDRKSKWDVELKGSCEKLIEDEVFDVYVLVGQYIRNFYYLDESWTQRKIKEFENPDNGQIWSGFMTGYLFGNHVYEKLYQLMKNHYLRSLSYTFKDNATGIRLSDHIGLAYLYGYDGFSPDNLFGTILTEKKYNKVKEIVNFFWYQRENIIGPGAEIEHSKRMRNKIIELWERMYGEFKDKISFADEEKELLSVLALLTTFLHEMNDQNFEWLMLSAPHVNLRFNYSFFIEYLDRLKDKGDRKKNARYLGNLFLKMLETFTPDFKPEHVKAVIEFIYLTKEKETSAMANEICNEYGKRGSDLLRDLYEKHKDL
jgi:hypothetical protein